ncbi:hypothetical protein SAMN05216252_1287 [Actinacidiphila glaucinigra]|uniref:Uncharacterized protein n=1 Tax=Actinacidiphila glaucinigra TaxID=235986 RepID=A0A239MWI1_9ACTN|nr:hypothetical protein SAMN05216252_1287 [Actinacidiphila glaucinigra]
MRFPDKPTKGAVAYALATDAAGDHPAAARALHRGRGFHVLGPRTGMTAYRGER